MVWSAIRALYTPRAALRGMRVHWGPLGSIEAIEAIEAFGT